MVRFLCLIVLTLTGSVAKADNLEVTSITNFPNCPAFSYREAVPLRDNSSALRLPPNVYCSRSNISDNLNSRARELVWSTLQAPEEIQRIAILTYSFNDQQYITDLCRLQATYNFQVDIVEARSFGLEPDGPAQVPASLPGPDCDLLQESDLLHYYLLGGSGGILSFHPKFIMVVYKDGATRVVHSTGHIRRGTTTNFDTWLRFDASANHARSVEAKCFAAAIVEMARASKSLYDYHDSVHDCFWLARSKSTSTTNEIYYLPFDRKRLLDALSSSIQQANSIDIAIEFYSPPSASLLRHVMHRALQGAKLRIVTDDDIIWAAARGCPDDDFLNQYLQVYCPAFQEWLLPLIKAGAEVRYAQTNHHCSGGNILHSKLIITHGTRQAVFVGSANLSEAAFGEYNSSDLSGNIENVVELRGQVLTKTLIEDFEKMFQLFSSVDSLPIVETQPAAESCLNFIKR